MMHPRILDLAASEAAGLSRRWPYQDRADIRQEILLYCLESGLDGRELPDEPPVDEDEYEAYRDQLKAVRYKLRDAGAQYCRQQERNRRRERAAVCGYRVEDEAFYSIGHLRILVEEYLASGVTEHPPVTRADSVRRTGDPAEGGNWPTVMLDIQRGLKMIPEHYRFRLWDRLAEHAHLSDEEYGWLHGLSEDQVRGRIRTALRALQSALGGASPWQRGPTPRSTPEHAGEDA